MIQILIGNIIALIASLLMVYSGTIKKKKKIIYVQSIQIGLFVASNLVLGGITGAIINFLSFIRNILCYKDKLGLKEKIILTILSVGLSLTLNNLGIIGLLPLVSTVTYLWLMNIKDMVKFKYLICFTMILWLIYDFSIKSYTAVIFDLFTIISNIIAIVQLKINSKEKRK
ncbi:MAG: YgjV family protein [Bacilli bacterium]|nr:YgjV family protein [Bacilli bacterium]